MELEEENRSEKANRDETSLRSEDVGSELPQKQGWTLNVVDV